MIIALEQLRTIVFVRITATRLRETAICDGKFDRVYPPTIASDRGCGAVQVYLVLCVVLDRVKLEDNLQFEPLREQTDRMGLELRKSLLCKALRISSAESIVTKRVALAELSSKF
jgi:hypothetical protein